MKNMMKVQSMWEEYKNWVWRKWEGYKECDKRIKNMRIVPRMWRGYEKYEDLYIFISSSHSLYFSHNFCVFFKFLILKFIFENTINSNRKFYYYFILNVILIQKINYILFTLFTFFASSYFHTFLTRFAPSLIFFLILEFLFKDAINSKSE